LSEANMLGGYCWIVRYLAGNKEANDPSTHKWMMYVRGPKDEPRIDHFVDKVIFLLHDTYKPNNIVTVRYEYWRLASLALFFIL